MGDTTLALADEATARRPLEVEAPLHVRRTDIEFRNLTPRRVRIGVRVQNRNDQWSPGTSLTLQTAPLGAFVPWRDVDTITVPPIKPGGIIEVSTIVATPRHTPPGEFSDLPPRRLLTALASEDEPPSRPDGSRVADAFAAITAALPSRILLPRGPRGRGPLAEDLFDRLGRRNVHWVGNINVLIGGSVVERHMAQALRIYPGRENVAMFLVGSRPDEYSFHLTGCGHDWEAVLYGGSSRREPLGCAAPPGQIPESEWVPMAGEQVVILVLCPPEDCVEGDVKVHVEQRSSGKEAVVEFRFDARAAGTGCYTMT